MLCHRCIIEDGEEDDKKFAYCFCFNVCKCMKADSLGICWCGLLCENTYKTGKDKGCQNKPISVLQKSNQRILSGIVSVHASYAVSPDDRSKMHSGYS